MNKPIDKTGGQAFPSVNDGWRELGMTLRDYFAGQALTRLSDFADASSEEDAIAFCDSAAEQAYALADAMLRVRK